MNPSIHPAVLAVALLATAPAIASDAHDKTAPTSEARGFTVLAQAAPATQAPAAALTDGEVRRIDRDQGKVTIKHGEIRNLEMPPMTMVFRVKDASMLDRLKPGDKIRFAADQVDGAYTVTQIEATK